MAPHRLLRHLLAVAILLCGLQACNLFNPSGEGTPDNVQGWIAEGDKCLAAKDYPAAANAYRQAIALEGRNDLAWNGWLEARAGMAQENTGISLAALLIETRKLNKEEEKPFWSLSIESQDRFYRYLGQLDNAYEVCLKGIGQSQFQDPIRMQAYTSIKTAWTLLRICDFNQDGRLTPSDTLILKVCRDVPGGIESIAGLVQLKSVDLSLLLSDPGSASTGTPDSALVAQLNALTVSSDSLFTRIDVLASDDPRWEFVQAFLQSKGREMVFYAASDAQDNDGDGCADEEVPDGHDNDGDGLIDEDARLGFRDSLGSFQGPGALSLRTTEDAITPSRLVGLNSVDGQARAGRKPFAPDTAGLHYVTLPLWSRFPGLLPRHEPHANPAHPGHASRHWKTKVEWTTSQVAGLGLGTTIPVTDDSADAQGPRLSHARLVDIRMAIREISDPARRQRAGRTLVGGCWMDVPSLAGRAH
ncbi:MAG: hypothetical protein RL318_478 [Fibrobacterota bacterium]|jgi:hypothetical protein